MPTASGSAYLELECPQEPSPLFHVVPSSLKLSCVIHGPKPLPRNANFSPNMQLTVHVKFAPFATRQRRGYVRDAAERDIGTHVETALCGVIIPDRWPKSAIDIVITILEAEDDVQWGSVTSQQQNTVGGLGSMNVVSGCITVASAALLDAKVDCLDLVTGGVAAVVPKDDGKFVHHLDPSPIEEPFLNSLCVVGYMPARDEMTLVWTRGNLPSYSDGQICRFDGLLDSAVNAARGAHVVLRQVATELVHAESTRLINDESKT